MLVAAQEEVAGREKRRYETEDGLSVVTPYIGPHGEASDHPDAFLVEYTPLPGCAIRPHFHKVQQFQVIVRGEGRLGKQPVAPFTFHFADGSTPYGPIAAADEQAGLAFLTLRAITKPGIWWMPGSLAEMDGRAGRNIAVASPEHPLLGAGASLETLIEPHPDGLAAHLMRLAPGESATAPSALGSGGQYHIVKRGALLVDGRTLTPPSVVFVDPLEEAPRHLAGADGAEVLVLQFPLPPSAGSSSAA